MLLRLELLITTATGRALFLLGVVFLSCTLIGASSCGFETRRSLLLPVPKNGPAIFDVTKFGAVADDKTDNIDVILIYFIIFLDATNELNSFQTIYINTNICMDK